MALMHVDFYSEVLSLNTSMDVIVPQTLKGKVATVGRNKERQCKTLYLLHGYTDDQTSWQRRTSIERYASQLGIVIVMPTTHLGFYTDTRYGMNYYTFLSEELPRICREFFPFISPNREDTLAAGLSMGGYGAWKLALGASETFGAAASLSGALDIVENYSRHMQGSERTQTLYNGIFGQEKDLVGSDNDIMALADKLVAQKKPVPRLYAWCGTEDHIAYEGNKKVWKYMSELGLEVFCEESAGGHQWKCWDVKIQDILRWWLETDMALD